MGFSTLAGGAVAANSVVRSRCTNECSDSASGLLFVLIVVAFLAAMFPLWMIARDEYLQRKVK